MNSSHLKQKLFQALHDLVAAGDIDKRLTHAGNYLVHLQEMQADFSNIDWLALRTKHSQWKKGRFHSSENHTDSEDFDAEIETTISYAKELIINRCISHE